MRGRLRSSGRAAAVCLLAILMTGCIKLNMDLQLQSDDTVDGSVIFAVNKQVLQLTGKSFDDLTGGQSAVPSGVPVQTSDYDDDQYSGKKYTFEDVPISRFSGDGSTDSLSIVHQGDTFVVSGALDLSAADTSQIPNADQAFSTADISLSITFPGAVQAASAGGVISGNTVTWKPTFGAKTEITATGSAIANGRGAAAVDPVRRRGVLIVLIVVLVLLARREAEGVGPGGGRDGDGGRAALGRGERPTPFRHRRCRRCAVRRSRHDRARHAGRTRTSRDLSGVGPWAHRGAAIRWSSSARGSSDCPARGSCEPPARRSRSSRRAIASAAEPRAATPAPSARR